MPGGSGFGDPKERDQKESAEDLKMGLIDTKAAKREYNFIQKEKIER